MWCVIAEIRKPKTPISYEVRIYHGKTRAHTFKCMGEGGARSWLADQGIPFHRQPRFVTVIKE